MFLGVYWLFSGSGDNENEKSVHDLLALVASPESVKTIEKVVVQPRGNDSAKYTVHFQSRGPKTVVYGPYAGSGNYITKALTVQDVNWTVEPEEENSFWENLLISWLPMIFLVVVFLFFMRRLQSGSGSAMTGDVSRTGIDVAMMRW